MPSKIWMIWGHPHFRKPIAGWFLWTGKCHLKFGWWLGAAPWPWKPPWLDDWMMIERETDRNWKLRIRKLSKVFTCSIPCSSGCSGCFVTLQSSFAKEGRSPGIALGMFHCHVTTHFESPTWMEDSKRPQAPYLLCSGIRMLVGGLVAMNFMFPYIGCLIIPIDVHIFQRGGPTTNQNGIQDIIWWNPVSRPTSNPIATSMFSRGWPLRV